MFNWKADENEHQNENENGDEIEIAQCSNYTLHLFHFTEKVIYTKTKHETGAIPSKTNTVQTGMNTCGNGQNGHTFSYSLYLVSTF